MLTSIIAAVIILGTLILIHEAGHFIVAKRCGVRVLRFSIGYPPKIFGIRRGETEYAIGATPFGGYVRMLGDEIGDELGSSDIQMYLGEIAQDLVQSAIAASAGEPELREVEQAEDRLSALAQALKRSADREGLLRRILGRKPRAEELDLLDEVQRSGDSAQSIKELSEHRTPTLTREIEKRSFPTQSLPKRFVIVLAGPAANILLAPLLLAVVYMYGVPRLLPVVGQLEKGMPAAAAGLHKGDRIVSIDGKPIHTWEDLSVAVKGSGGAPLKIGVKRPAGKSGQLETLTMTPVHTSEPTSFGGKAKQWVIGVLPSGASTVHRENPLVAVPHAVIETGRMCGMLVVGIVRIFTGSTPVRQALGGPIMIAQLAGREARQGLANVLMFAVMLSVELGIINLLPVPMLDGGHLFFFLLEGVRGRPLQVRHREIAQQVGLFLLVMLMAFVIFNDISRIVQG